MRLPFSRELRPDRRSTGTAAAGWRPRGGGCCAPAAPPRPSTAPVQRVGGARDVVRVDHDRVLAELVVRARLAREHERAAVARRHRHLLGDQVHAVADRVDEQHVGEPVRGERPGEVVVHVRGERVPVRRCRTRRRSLGDPLDRRPCTRGTPAGRAGSGRRTPDGRPGPPLRVTAQELAVGLAGRATMFFDSSVRSTRTIACRSPSLRRSAPSRDLDVGLRGALAQRSRRRRRARARRAGSCARPTSPRCRPVDLGAEHLRAAVGERARPARRVEARVVGAEHARAASRGRCRRAAAGSSRPAPTACARSARCAGRGAARAAAAAARVRW